MGTPRTIDDVLVDAVIAKTLESVPRGATHRTAAGRSSRRDSDRLMPAFEKSRNGLFAGPAPLPRRAEGVSEADVVPKLNSLLKCFPPASIHARCDGGADAALDEPREPPSAKRQRITEMVASWVSTLLPDGWPPRLFPRAQGRLHIISTMSESGLPGAMPGQQPNTDRMATVG